MVPVCTRLGSLHTHSYLLPLVGVHVPEKPQAPRHMVIVLYTAHGAGKNIS